MTEKKMIRVATPEEEQEVRRVHDALKNIEHALCLAMDRVQVNPKLQPLIDEMHRLQRARHEAVNTWQDFLNAHLGVTFPTLVSLSKDDWWAP